MLNYCKGNEFDLHKNTQLIYHLNGCAPGLASKLRHAATRKWAIKTKLRAEKQFHDDRHATFSFALFSQNLKFVLLLSDFGCL